MSEVDLAALSAASASLVETTAARIVCVTDGRRELSGLVWTDEPDRHGRGMPRQ